MSWGEEVRCLYCDGRLPMYRKLTDGQFCSAGHRKAYWVESQRLGVERLHQFQTGSFAIPELQKPAEALTSAVTPTGTDARTSDRLETLLHAHSNTLHAVPDLEGSTPFPVAGALITRSSDNGMPAAGLLALPLHSTDDLPRTILAADPIEYEIQVRPLPSLIERRKARRSTGELSAAGPVSMKRVPAADRATLANAIPEAPDWVRLVAQHPGSSSSPAGSSQSLTGCGDWGPVAAPAVRLPWTPVDYRLDATKRAEPARFPAGLASIPVCDVAPADEMADEMNDAIGALIPALLHPLRLLAPGARDQACPAAAAVDALGYGTAPRLPVTSWFVKTGVGLERLAPLPIEAVEMQITLHDDGVAAIPGPPQVRFQLPGKPVELAASVGWGTLAVLPWSAEGQTPAGSHLSMIGLAEFEVFGGVIHRPAFEVQREIASLKGSSQQRKLWAPLVRDDAASRATQVPRVYFAPQPASQSPLLPVARLEPVDAAPSLTPAMEFVFAPQRSGSEGAPAPRPKTLRHVDDAFEIEPTLLERLKIAPVIGFWKNAPRDLKMLAIALPVLIGLAIQPSLPKVRVTASVPNPEISRVVETQWNGLRRNILDRAGVELSDDFRGGLDAWQSKADLAETWSYDQSGFVKPGPLALYEPSLKLTDYQVQFLGQISKKALGFVYRAADLDNYYVAKLVILKPGPLPIVGVQRYAVVNGRPGPKVEKILPISARNGMFYRVRLDVEGEFFALSVQGHLVDFWSDSRWKSGGVGFFNSPGEESRVRWVQVSHQYDALGRLCAYLAPYSVQGSPGGIKE